MRRDSNDRWASLRQAQSLVPVSGRAPSRDRDELCMISACWSTRSSLDAQSLDLLGIANAHEDYVLAAVGRAVTVAVLKEL